jgi:hypothetical protein
MAGQKEALAKCYTIRFAKIFKPFSFPNLKSASLIAVKDTLACFLPFYISEPVINMKFNLYGLDIDYACWSVPADLR